MFFEVVGDQSKYYEKLYSNFRLEPNFNRECTDYDQDKRSLENFFRYKEGVIVITDSYIINHPEIIENLEAGIQRGD